MGQNVLNASKGVQNFLPSIRYQVYPTRSVDTVDLHS
jgi:hypothetical protein